MLLEILLALFRFGLYPGELLESALDPLLPFLKLLAPPDGWGQSRPAVPNGKPDRYGHQPAQHSAQDPQEGQDFLELFIHAPLKLFKPLVYLLKPLVFTLP